MARTTVRLRTDNLADSISSMRIWLDQHRFEPDLFRYEIGADGATILVEFKHAAEAAAFEEAFSSGDKEPRTSPGYITVKALSRGRAAGISIE